MPDPLEPSPVERARQRLEKRISFYGDMRNSYDDGTMKTGEARHHVTVAVDALIRAVREEERQITNVKEISNALVNRPAPRSWKGWAVICKGEFVQASPAQLLCENDDTLVRVTIVEEPQE